MKTLKLLIILLFLPLVFHAQKSLTGLWTGSLSNDTTTIRKDQAFEIALTEYRGKIYGYSRSAFIVHDTLFYIVKRVKGKIEDGICEVKDDEIISSNFPGRRDKGVGVTITFRLNKEDTTWHLDGNWKTNKTKNYYSISGKIALKEEKDLDNSKIFPHLEELALDKDVPFYQEAKNPPVVAVAKKETARPPVIPKETKPAPVPETKVETTRIEKKKNIEQEKKVEEKATAKIDPPKETKKEIKPVVATEAKPETGIVKSEKNAAPNNSSSTLKPKEPEPVKVVAPVIAPPAAKLAERKTTPPQIVDFKTDSLELALYDNGEVDGDTVSVLMNGEIILAKQGLKSSAIKKSIKIDPTSSEMTLVLYAENLGKYPPNTGLLVVHDGDDTYQIRFSADLQQNATIIFRRKK